MSGLIDDYVGEIPLQVGMVIVGSCDERAVAYDMIQSLEAMITQHLQDNCPGWQIVTTQPVIGVVDEPENLD